MSTEPDSFQYLKKGDLPLRTASPHVIILSCVQIWGSISMALKCYLLFCRMRLKSSHDVAWRRKVFQTV